MVVWVCVLGGCHGIRWRGFGFAGVGCGGFGFAGVGVWVGQRGYGFEIGMREGDSERRVSKKKNVI